MGSIARLPGRSVLVVEDEPLIAIGLKELFEAEGANVDIASTPDDALRLVDEIVYSVAVLDFGSAGDEKAPLCGTLRACGIPFMYYTGYGDLDEGSSGPPVVTKPASAEALITTIAQLLNLPSQSTSSARN
jgi:DNA-binding response OmpR family regulator